MDESIPSCRALVVGKLSAAFDGWVLRCLRTVPPNTRPFCAEYNYAGKADLSTGR